MSVPAQVRGEPSTVERLLGSFRGRYHGHEPRERCPSEAHFVGNCWCLGDLLDKRNHDLGDEDALR